MGLSKTNFILLIVYFIFGISYLVLLTGLSPFCTPSLLAGVFSLNFPSRYNIQHHKSTSQKNDHHKKMSLPIRVVHHPLRYCSHQTSIVFLHLSVSISSFVITHQHVRFIYHLSAVPTIVTNSTAGVGTRSV